MRAAAYQKILPILRDALQIDAICSEVLISKVSKARPGLLMGVVLAQGLKPRALLRVDGPTED